MNYIISENLIRFIEHNINLVTEDLDELDENEHELLLNGRNTIALRAEIYGELLTWRFLLDTISDKPEIFTNNL
jgi:hypothetical protein